MLRRHSMTQNSNSFQCSKQLLSIVRFSLVLIILFCYIMMPERHMRSSTSASTVLMIIVQQAALCCSVSLTLPRSMMKQSPWLKLSHDRGTSVARITLRPLTWNNRFTSMSLVTTCLKPEATPPCCV